MGSHHAVTSPLNQASREGSWWQQHGRSNQEKRSAQSHHAVTSPLNQASREGSWWRLHGGSGPGEWSPLHSTRHHEKAAGGDSHGRFAWIILRGLQLLVPEIGQHWPASRGHCGREARGCRWPTSTSCQRGLTDVERMCPSEHHGWPYGPREAVPGSGMWCLARPGSYSPPGGLLVNAWGNTPGVPPTRTAATAWRAKLRWPAGGQRRETAGSSIVVDLIVQSLRPGHGRGQLPQWSSSTSAAGMGCWCVSSFPFCVSVLATGASGACGSGCTGGWLCAGWLGFADTVAGEVGLVSRGWLTAGMEASFADTVTGEVGSVSQGRGWLIAGMEAGLAGGNWGSTSPTPMGGEAASPRDAHSPITEGSLWKAPTGARSEELSPTVGTCWGSSALGRSTQAGVIWITPPYHPPPTPCVLLDTLRNREEEVVGCLLVDFLGIVRWDLLDDVLAGLLDVQLALHGRGADGGIGELVGWCLGWWWGKLGDGWMSGAALWFLLGSRGWLPGGPGAAGTLYSCPLGSHSGIWCGRPMAVGRWRVPWLWFSLLPPPCMSRPALGLRLSHWVELFWEKGSVATLGLSGAGDIRFPSCTGASGAATGWETSWGHLGQGLLRQWLGWEMSKSYLGPWPQQELPELDSEVGKGERAG